MCCFVLMHVPCFSPVVFGSRTKFDQNLEPMVFEEYGVPRASGQRLNVIRNWHNIVLANAIAGDM